MQASSSSPRSSPRTASTAPWPRNAPRSAASPSRRSSSTPPLAECERRDPKQLYKKARAGQIQQFTGIDSPYEAPLSPDIEIRTDRETVGDSIERLTELALGLARPSEQTGAGLDI